MNVPAINPDLLAHAQNVHPLAQPMQGLPALHWIERISLWRLLVICMVLAALLNLTSKLFFSGRQDASSRTELDVEILQHLKAIYGELKTQNRLLVEFYRNVTVEMTVVRREKPHDMVKRLALVHSDFTFLPDLNYLDGSLARYDPATSGH